MDSVEDNKGEEATTEVQVTFRSSLPPQYAISEEIQIQMSSNSVARDISDVLKQMITEEGALSGAEDANLKTRKLQFMVNDVFLTSTLQDLMTKVSLTSESVLEVWYSFALDKPRPTMSIPQEEWISVLKSLHHQKNVKARTYIATFFNGDIKIFDGKDAKKQSEVYVRAQHHQGQITDALFFKADDLDGKKYLVTCSEQPCPELKVCEVDTQSRSIKEMVCASPDLAESLNGFSSLALNPLSQTLFASASRDYVRPAEGSSSNNRGPIQLWQLDSEVMNAAGAVQSSLNGLKRQRVEAAAVEFQPKEYVQVKGGVSSLTWLDGDSLVAGCGDHAIKIIDVENAYVIKQSILTDNKLPTCMDTAFGNLILAGCEDGVVRLFDTRVGSSSTKGKQLAASFASHGKYIQQVCFNPQVENVFLSGGMDGVLKLWDIRNDDVPLANMKHKSKDSKEDFKVFAVDWNGASQILSGGSDSHISVHSM